MNTNIEKINTFKASNIMDVTFNIVIDKCTEFHLFSNNIKYLDFTSGYGVASLGWYNKDINRELIKKSKNAHFAPPWLVTKETINFNEVLMNLMPLGLKNCAKAISGTEANETIYKAIVATNGKTGVVSFKNSYHGGSCFALNLSISNTIKFPKVPKFNEMHLVEPPYCYRCKFNKKPETCNIECADAIVNLLKTNTKIGSVFIEPVLGSGGVIIIPKKYLEFIRSVTLQYNVFLVIDEVLTGFGRIGSIHSQEIYNVTADAISFGKGITSGYAALSAAVLNDELATSLKKREDVSSSLAWSPIACFASQIVIEKITQVNLSLNSNIFGKNIAQALTKLFNKYLPNHFGDLRQIGLLIGIELVKDLKTKEPYSSLVKRIIIKSMQHQLILTASWNFNVLVIMPPLIINTKIIEEAIYKLEKVLIEICAKH